MRSFLKHAPNQIAHNPFGTGGPAETVYTGVKTTGRSGSPVQLTATSTPLRWGVYFVADSTDATENTEVVFIGTTDQKPTYNSGSSPVSTGLACEFNSPVFIEIDDLSDIWLDTTDNSLKITYVAA